MNNQMRLKLWSELPLRDLHSKIHFIDLVGSELHRRSAPGRGIWRCNQLAMMLRWGLYGQPTTRHGHDREWP
jgi:hypothetical protein